ncbi:hypothetical protein GCM10010102_19940 [Promicromonospora citrea]|uniref:Uncharacterized protein n=1 Tax=Promicromonospora citrea TaxID=43677 RepID=A0A8H9L556_9MICO|nr:hypothetical protein GCM10010102_19940 [Promicromonospora citrea]
MRARITAVPRRAGRAQGAATGASSARISAESHDSLDPALRVDVPSAITTYPRDIEQWPRPWAQERWPGTAPDRYASPPPNPISLPSGSRKSTLRTAP